MNKYKSLILIIFFICVFSLSKVNANINNLSLLGKVIYLDAGHGGVDSGAVSNNLLEKDMNLILVKKLEIELSKKGAIVYLTRDNDTDLATSTKYRKRSDLTKRVKLINDSKCNMYISIHLNSSTNKLWNGIQLFYNKNNSKNKIIAETITNSLKENLSTTKKVKEENDYYMYKQIIIPGVLIEAGYISNDHDNYLLRQTNYQDKLVKFIANGVEKYFNN